MKERIAVPTSRDGWVALNRMPARQHPLHRHDEFEINLVARGRCTYLIDGRRYEMRRDDLLVLFPAQDHVLIERSRDNDMWIVVWTPEAARRVLTGAREAWTRERPSGDFLWRLDPQRARALAGVCECIRVAASDESANAGLASLLLSAWDAACASPIGEARDVHPAVQDAVRRLRADPTFDGRTLARTVGLSRTRLSRLFRAQIGVPLTTYRSRLRLERARDLLAGGRANLLEAALGAGFGSYAQFHRVVRAQLGVSPKQLLGEDQGP